MSREFVERGKAAKEKRGEVLSVAPKTWYMIGALKAPMAAIRRLIEKLTPFVLGSAPVIGAIRNLVGDSHHDSGETRMASLEKAMELQATLNEKNEVQLKIVEALLENVQRSQDADSCRDRDGHRRRRRASDRSYEVNKFRAMASSAAPGQLRYIRLK